MKWCQVPNLIYIFEFSPVITNMSDWRNAEVNKTRTCSYLLTGLQPETRYRVKVRSIWRNGQVGAYVSREFDTVASDVQPAGVKDLEVDEVWPEDTQTTSVRLTWSHSAALPCQYRLVVWENTTSSHPEVFQVSYPEDLNQTVLNLKYEASYKLGVSAVSSSEQESDNTWINYNTPPCLKFHPNNLSVCRPPAPSKLSVQERMSQFGQCELVFHWSKPEATPAHYNLTLTQYDFSSEGTVSVHTISICGNCTETTVPALDRHSNYLMSLVALSPGGRSDPVQAYRSDICSKQYTGSFFGGTLTNGLKSARLVTALSISCFLVIIITALLFCLKQKKRQRKNFSYFKTGEKFTKSGDDLSLSRHEADEYEVPNDSLLICDIIGEGAFGVVHKGLLSKTSGAPQEVAVKMLRDNPTAEESREFQKEIAVMKTVGKHKNIVSLVGCCTQSYKLLLIVEFCALGDLQNYLRQEWKKQTQVVSESTTSGNIKYADIAHVDSNGSYNGPVLVEPGTAGLVTNAMYDFYIKPRDCDNKTLSERLLSFSRQIAVGMEYLSSNRVVHRDLAARNILVCSDNSIKISDFGLSRDVYEQNVYRKKSSEKLPVKWMALESLLHQMYTTQSDVWSFGIVLWEIATLGGNPYPSTPTNQMFRLLKHGYRMEQPPTCSSELYSIMVSCWKEKPSDRPTFSALVTQLSKLLESASPHQYLDLDNIQGWAVHDTDSDS